MNSIVTPTWVLKDVGLGYINEVSFIRYIRQYNNAYEHGGAKTGMTVQYRLPQQWRTMQGQALQLQSINDRTVPIVLSNQLQIAFDWSSASATTEIEDVRERYTMPAGRSMASAADAFAFLQCYPAIYQSIGTPGTPISNTLSYFLAGVKLSDSAAPRAPRIQVLDSMAMATIANTTTTLFNPGGTVGDNYRSGQFAGRQLGFSEWYEDQNAPVHTTGSFTASTPLVNGASQTGSSLVTDGWASGATTLNRGDIFTLAGVFGVNPLSYVSTGRLQQFVVTATISDTTGAITMAISPSIITTGQLQTVTASPANDAAITVWSANPVAGTLAATPSKVSMAFHPEAFAFVTADLDMPNGGAEAGRINSASNALALRIAKQWDIRTDQNATRIDALVGAAVTQPRLAVREQG